MNDEFVRRYSSRTANRDSRVQRSRPDLQNGRFGRLIAVCVCV